MHSVHAVERRIPLRSLGGDIDNDDANTELAPPPLTPFGSDLQAASTGPASRSAGGMTRHEATRLHLQGRTADLKGKTIGKFQPNPKNTDPSRNLLITRLASVPERRLPSA
ncbi:hypothetical protein Bca4012_093068 [Brassica carinata]|uniref:Uncharacterized protein n=1 Tax=Brassica oleracea TaxID=3712 RepID=A0A3P6G3T7_BRAOL|nr:unnamed protein product [Brassica oleracea]